MLMARRRATLAGLDFAVGEVIAKLAKVAMMVMIENCIFDNDSESSMVSKLVKSVTEERAEIFTVRN